MNLITAPSKSSQVAKIIRQQILSGQLAPNTKLQSVRSLADKFSVGRQVILSALNILEQEKLVHTKARQGAFVVDRGLNTSGRGIYILAFGVEQGNKFLQRYKSRILPR